MKTITVDGNEACSYTSYLFTELAGIYPITPSSPMAEHIDEWNKERLNIFNRPVKVVEMQSEAGAAGFIHGSLQSGCLTTTYTSSQGLLLMIPNMYKMAGEMLPAVIHVAARSLSTHALSIMGDHQDIYATRSTGFCYLASSSVQDAAHLSAIAHLSALKISLPFVHFFDGFRTSHEIDKINILEANDYQDIIPFQEIEKFRKRALNPNNPKTIGTAEGDDIYFQITEARNKFYDQVPDIVNEYMQKINQKVKTNYKPFNYYGHSKANSVIVAMGSVNETIKETIDYLTKLGYKIGLMEVHLYRPFSKKYFLNELPKSVKRIAVLDRTKEQGSREPLYLDVCNILKDSKIKIVGGRYGLSSKNTTPSQIKAVYDMLNNGLKDNFTIGIDDDVTHLSLLVKEGLKISDSNELLIYGYGSDGMVGASKTIMKLVGENTDNYVQGYFEYDSKKSGGMTISHLRFNKKPIRSTYYVNNPNTVVVSKDSYLKLINPLSDIKENGTFLLNTTKTKDELNQFLSTDIKKIINDRKINFYTIDATTLSRKIGLKNKISTIMESAIVKLADILDYDMAIKKMKKYATDRYFKKGDDIVEKNFLALDQASEFLTKIDIDNLGTYQLKNETDNIYEAMRLRKGTTLPVSAFLDVADGCFTGGTSSLDKRGVTQTVPKWLNSNCIMCNQCSLICPHGVIRPFLLNEDEYNNALDIVKNRCVKDALGQYYCLGISVMDCTGCGLCIKNCPGKKGEKALIGSSLTKEIANKEQEIYDYLVNNVTVKDTYKTNSVKGSQFKESKFKFHGACAGCGQTAYIKLLTQLFGENLIISNATGCSSIYGASMPSLPYTLPWSSSLFEDNAEYGYGMLIANNVIKERLKSLMAKENDPLCQEWLENINDYEVTKKVYDQLNYKNINSEISDLKEFIIASNVWTIGGDGWAYDIGFGGIDHVLSTNDNVKILVLDSEVYSNTGGQSSKATPKGSIASFSSMGKKTSKKNLARYALTMPHVYVGTVNLGANYNQTIKTLIEANNYDGPAIVIAYTPCIAHGIKGGLENSIDMEKLATNCGYFPLFRYDPVNRKFTLDSKNINFDLYEKFLNNQTRYNMLEVINKEKAHDLLKQNKKDAEALYEFYNKLDKGE